MSEVFTCEPFICNVLYAFSICASHAIYAVSICASSYAMYAISICVIFNNFSSYIQLQDGPAGVHAVHVLLGDELHHSSRTDDSGWGLRLLLLGLGQEQGHPQLPHCWVLLEES